MKKLAIYGGLIITFLLSAGDFAHAQTKKKKGISQQGKGAIIGGAAGAVAGGLIGQDVKGAVIGGALGAGGGYVIGNEKRLSKEKKERAYRRSLKKKKKVN
ncbi:hypothetical protein GCM10023149_42820 [Mucilaginibacter gynuensis]|uniref:YMGG-like Gly-zipper domain-containing protein n=1 Tax=Mucilaginibacter gynuensis TaxID=1302236 RepID=A0ABP8H6C9_9SPHI